MNYMMIFTSVFLFGVCAGLLLAHILTQRNENQSKRLRDWKSNF